MIKKHYKALFIIATLALLIAVTMCGIALDHNPSGEFYKCSEGPGLRDCVIQWKSLAWLGGSWFLLVSSICGLPYLCALLVRHFKKLNRT
jgi:ABC-type Fe3+ transport system permease subunit